MRQFNIELDKTSPKTSQFTLPAYEHFSILVQYKNWEDRQEWLDYTLADQAGADIVKYKKELESNCVLYFCSYMSASGALHFKSSTDSPAPRDTIQIVALPSSTQDNCYICSADYARTAGEGGGGGVSKEYVDTKVQEEADAREAAIRELSAGIPTKTSELSNDSGFIGTEQLSDYYTKQQTDEAISSALSSAGNSKYIESEDGTQRIYGNGDVSTLSSAPGTYGPWTDEKGNVDDTWSVTEISAGVFCYVHGEDYSYRSIDTWTSREEAENAKTFITTGDGNVWTKPYIPGAENWVKEGELALKTDVSAVTESLRYKLITKTLQEGTYNNQSVLTCQIDDRTITTIVVSSSEKNVVLYMPPKPADGGARDFIIRVEVTASTAPGFYFVGASETINYDSGDEDWNVLEPGLNLISFTETK